MDPVTHTLVGVGIANAFFRKRIGKAAVPILALASNLPDIDGAVMLTGDPTAVLMRRTFGHSLFLLPIWIVALCFIFRRYYPHLRWGTLIGLTSIGALVHLFFDLVNSFGVVLLWPFSDWRPELGIIFIIDLILTGLLAAPLFLSRIPSMRESLVPLSRGAVALVAAYVLLCVFSRAQAERLLEEGSTQPADFSYVFPEPLGPHRWRGVWREGNLYRVYLLHLFSGVKEERDQVVTEIGDPRVEKARTTPLARRIEWFFKAPVWQIDEEVEGGSADTPADVSVYDLRFKTLVVERSVPFVYRFRVDDEARAAD
ncbi:MAG: metal-dependent hydrolase [Candidatus Manganitrophus sp.]|nr:MAG: metal-dependent hydrolase [Candidatus Manganitrophus sp.]